MNRKHSVIFGSIVVAWPISNYTIAKKSLVVWMASQKLLLVSVQVLQVSAIIPFNLWDITLFIELEIGCSRNINVILIDIRVSQHIHPWSEIADIFSIAACQHVFALASFRCASTNSISASRLSALRWRRKQTALLLPLKKVLRLKILALLYLKFLTQCRWPPSGKYTCLSVLQFHSMNL